MTRRAFRVSYMLDADNVLQQTTFYGESTADAQEYAEGLFHDLIGGFIAIVETGDVGVPDDDVLLGWAEASTPEVIEEMRSPGNVNG